MALNASSDLQGDFVPGSVVDPESDTDPVRSETSFRIWIRAALTRNELKTKSLIKSTIKLNKNLFPKK
jgi:hypothetical protein